MTRLRFLLILSLFFLTSALAQSGGQAYLLKINGAIGPATHDYIVQGIKKAEAQNSNVLILQLDTPGGLDLSMRGIIKAILNSTVPVAAYVAPSGARAASAGTYILYASHIAAMAPGTNLGAATPVSLTGQGSPMSPEEKKGQTKKNSSDMENKIRQDAMAYIKSLAELRGRNAKWAIEAVDKSVSISAKEALKLKVIDFIAPDTTSLLKQINGREVIVKGVREKVNSANLTIQEIKLNWKNRVLSIITDPSIAYILLLIGIYGIFFEFFNPGYVLPGVAGAICLLIALYALHLLPVNYAGLALIILGIIFLVAEAFMPSFGALGFGGIIAFVLGSFFLIDSNSVFYQIDWWLILIMAAVNAIFFLVVIGMALKLGKKKVVTGQEQLLGMIGEALENFDHEGLIFIVSERWNARSSVPVKKGQKVKVIKIEGLTLFVVPLENST